MAGEFVEKGHRAAGKIRPFGRLVFRMAKRDCNQLAHFAQKLVVFLFQSAYGPLGSGESSHQFIENSGLFLLTKMQKQPIMQRK